MQRYHCPRHEESTPSVVVYEDCAYCFGGCGRIELSELGPHVRAAAKPPPEDIASTLARISSLPLASVRGLSLPVDGDSYYLVWPDGTYYKRRQFFPEQGTPKYRCPRGHAKPLFIAKDEPKATLLTLVEGELNALSLAAVAIEGSIASPGGVGDFGERLEKHAAFILRHKKFRLVLDADSPGLEAAIATKKALLRHSCYVEIVLMVEDANDLLQKGVLKDETDKWPKL